MLFRSLYSRIGIDIKKAKDAVFYRAMGCSVCLNTGYSGRVGICEILVLTPAIRELVLKRARENEVKNIAITEGMKTLREDGVAKVLAGLTSLEEVMRVTVADE